MAAPRVLLLCSTPYAVPTLQALQFFNQLAIVGIPDYGEDMKIAARQLLKDSETPIEILHKKTFEKKIIALIKKYEVNTGLIATFRYKLSPAVYELPGFGFFNLHPGDLPSFRGVDPVFQTIRLREKTAAVTLHKVDSDFDTGPVVIRESIRLDPRFTAGILYEKLGLVAAKLATTLTKMIAMDLKIPLKPQDESRAVYYKAHGADDVCINWMTMSAENIIALINACNPWNKGAITSLNGRIIRLLEASLIEGSQAAPAIPGKILSIDEKGMIVSTINEQSLLVPLVSVNEGFLLAARLSEFGIQRGQQFNQVDRIFSF